MNCSLVSSTKPTGKVSALLVACFGFRAPIGRTHLVRDLAFPSSFSLQREREAADSSRAQLTAMLNEVMFFHEHIGTTTPCSFFVATRTEHFFWIDLFLLFWKKAEAKVEVMVFRPQRNRTVFTTYAANEQYISI
jgi:hypothetical protein